MTGRTRLGTFRRVPDAFYQSTLTRIVPVGGHFGGSVRSGGSTISAGYSTAALQSEHMNTQRTLPLSRSRPHGLNVPLQSECLWVGFVMGTLNRCVGRRMPAIAILHPKIGRFAARRAGRPGTGSQLVRVLYPTDQAG